MVFCKEAIRGFAAPALQYSENLQPSTRNTRSVLYPSMLCEIECFRATLGICLPIFVHLKDDNSDRVCCGGWSLREAEFQHVGLVVALCLRRPRSSRKGPPLATCRTIIEAHGGRIWCTPNPAGGAIFHFTVPIAEGAG
jgi:hypothetical protein